MQKASEALEFEKALEYRDLLHSVQKIAQKQKMTDTAGEDRDILAVATEEEDAVVQVFFIRGGRLIGRDHFYLKITAGEAEREILSSFIKQFYAGTPYIPAELMLPEEIEDRQVIEEWLTKKEATGYILRFRRRGQRRNLWNWRQRMHPWF